MYWILVVIVFGSLLSACHGTASTICRAPPVVSRGFCEQPPVENVDLEAYLGSWYNAYASPNAHFVSKPGCSIAWYTSLPDNDIGVLNCYFVPGEMVKPQCASGRARRGSESGRLLVGFGGGTGSEGPYNVAGLLGDAEYGYSAAAVYSCVWRNGKPQEKWWVLVRDPYRPEEKLRQLRWALWCKGYDVKNVVFEKTKQGDGCKYWYGRDGYNVQPPRWFKMSVRTD